MGPVGKSFGTCDHAPGQRTMFELVLLLNSSSSRSFVSEMERSKLPRPERWKTIAHEVAGAFTYVCSGCKRASDGRVQGSCGHATAILTKKAAVPKSIGSLSVNTFNLR